ncbi:MAG: diaminopimelate epimerase [Clostridiales Family XIII bacterium]|nr:diaminopimelate epimerase [Clostridiales Family XIII bacterium]
MLRFSKYHGCGNDFILIREDDAPRYANSEEMLAQLARTLCRRTTGIGADGLIIVRRSPLGMDVYNSDGSRAPMCGNGIRCFAKYCFDEDVISPALHEYDVSTLAGQMHVRIESTDPFMVAIDMGKPDFSVQKMGIDVTVIGGNPGSSSQTSFLQRRLDAGGKMVTVDSVFMGTIHTVVWVSEKDGLFLEKSGGTGVSDLWHLTDAGGLEVAESLITLGKKLSEHPVYTEKTNVNFVSVLDRGTIEMVTYERGAGLTAACGTGACAAGVLGLISGKLDRSVRVTLPYGVLNISIGENEAVFMTGPAVCIASGKYYEE